MPLSQDFVGWIYGKFGRDPGYRLISPQFWPEVGGFNLCLERTGSLLKGKQTQLYRILPPGLTIEQANALAMERQRVVATRSSLAKLLQDFLAFFYITDVPIHPQVLAYLADFRSVRKSVLGNVSQLNFLLDTSTGSYLVPEKLGWFGWIPIKNLRNEIQTDILEPFRVWRQQQMTAPQIADGAQQPLGRT